MAKKTLNFNEKVWELTKKIPKGKVSTYKELAHALKTRAYRAVGNALNKNPHAPIVPCHRIVLSNGSVGGFAHGSKKKMNLLKKEGINFEKENIQNFEKVLYKF